jgi:hypothetical protein
MGLRVSDALLAAIKLVTRSILPLFAAVFGIANGGVRLRTNRRVTRPERGAYNIPTAAPTPIPMAKNPILLPLMKIDLLLQMDANLPMEVTIILR